MHRTLRPVVLVAAAAAALLSPAAGAAGAPGATAATPAAARPDTPVATATAGPALRTPAATLAAAISCSGDVARSPLTPVLLVHGTGSTPQESWGAAYLPLFAAEGRPTCTVALPERATTDEQVSAEYVVAAVRAVHARRGGRIDVLGHSQGAFLPVVAVKFWPDLAADIEDYVGLAPTFTVGVSGEAMCAVSCTAPFQQRRAGSGFFAGFLAHPLPPGPSYTTIATLTDEIAAPEPSASHLDGATNVVLQDSCPAKAVDHFALLTDGTVHDLVLDALLHDGPTDPARLPLTACTETLPAGADPATVAPLAATAVANDLAANGSATKLTAEPPVRCFLSAACADVDDRGRLLTGASVAGGVLRLDAQAPGTVLATARSGDATRVLPAVAVALGATSVPLDLPPDLPPGDWTVELRTTTAYYTVAGLERSVGVRVPAAQVAPTARRTPTAVHAPAARAAGTVARGQARPARPEQPARTLAFTGPPWVWRSPGCSRWAQGAGSPDARSGCAPAHRARRGAPLRSWRAGRPTSRPAASAVGPTRSGSAT